MSDIPAQVIQECRALLTRDYLPKIERCLERLTDEMIWWRPNAESNSIGNLLLHLAGNVRHWIVSGIPGTPSDRVRQQEFDERTQIPRADLSARLNRAIQEADGILARLEPERLLETRPIRGREVTLLYALLHVVEHFAMHAGQIIMLTKIMRSEDLQFYDMSGSAPVTRWHKEGEEE